MEGAGAKGADLCMLTHDNHCPMLTPLVRMRKSRSKGSVGRLSRNLSFALSNRGDRLYFIVPVNAFEMLWGRAENLRGREVAIV